MFQYFQNFEKTKVLQNMELKMTKMISENIKSQEQIERIENDITVMKHQQDLDTTVFLKFLFLLKVIYFTFSVVEFQYSGV